MAAAAVAVAKEVTFYQDIFAYIIQIKCIKIEYNRESTNY